MDYINQFTYNTGHNRKSYPSDIGKEFLFNFLPMVNKYIESGEICDYLVDTRIRITTNDDDLYVASLYIVIDGDDVPVFMTMGTSNKHRRKEIINEAKKMRDLCRPDTIYMPPEAPLIIDFILPAMAVRPELAHLTGDLSKCLAWTILDPGAVLK